ncbi:hypothetical protein Abu_1682 [Aliarcobacter butzleri RM4018]|uniref:Uncharacterized protein n=1 Tax=Aliarcobacter butzleri (strain RM4018) TaxID=367737 RepID=A8EVF6_ALIB4|nr:hypothetical protein [Aliarcobacter butzleri]ABV67929.1 hypothetical protein Abu_1682 [Aliarcobacter butzleri RM4018]GGT78545.1 hypothetical protein GCM10007985_13650 [Aliarcobacter butzleri]SNV31197.1 Uncharacterised protein [Aliarcobacter butzleri]
MNILTVNTGNEKLDEAYKRMQIHICTYDKVDEFINYFNSITKNVKEDELLKWLLKVLFWEFKYGRVDKKHDFDLLLEKVEPKDKVVLEKWLKEKLEKVKNV